MIAGLPVYDHTRNQVIQLELPSTIKDQLRALISQELRTPLNVIIGYAELLREGVLGKLNSQQAQTMREISAEVYKQLAMIESILLAIKLELDSVEVHGRQVNLAALMVEMQADYDIVTMGRPFRVDWEYAKDLPVVIVDVGKLKHILRNLVGNAIKANGQARVFLDYMADKERIRICVGNAGTGISEKAGEAVFEIIKKVDSSNRSLDKESSLGLYIVRKYTEILGGTIQVERELGNTTSFTVEVPCSRVASQQA